MTNENETFSFEEVWEAAFHVLLNHFQNDYLMGDLLESLTGQPVGTDEQKDQIEAHLTKLNLTLHPKTWSVHDESGRYMNDVPVFRPEGSKS